MLNTGSNPQNNILVQAAASVFFKGAEVQRQLSKPGSEKEKNLKYQLLLHESTEDSQKTEQSSQGRFA